MSLIDVGRKKAFWATGKIMEIKQEEGLKQQVPVQHWSLLKWANPSNKGQNKGTSLRLIFEMCLFFK